MIAVLFSASRHPGLDLRVIPYQLPEGIFPDRAHSALVLATHRGRAFGPVEETHLSEKSPWTNFPDKFVLFELVPHQNLAVALGQDVQMRGGMVLLYDVVLWHECHGLDVANKVLDCLGDVLKDGDLVYGVKEHVLRDHLPQTWR